MFTNYVRSMVMGQPFQPMFEAHDDGGGAGSGTGDQGGQGDQGGGDGGQGQSGSGDQGGSGGEGNQGGDKDKDKVEFSESQQTFINNLINKTIKDERTKAEQKRQQELDRQKMDDKQKAEADLKDAQDKIKAMNDRTLGFEIKDMARDLGVPAKKLDRFLKVVDRDGLMDDDGNIDKSKVKQAVEGTLGDMPEFKGSDAHKGPGDFSGGGGETVKYSMAQINAMSPEEIKNNYDDVMKSVQFHNKK
jgi:hypothetical protein